METLIILVIALYAVKVVVSDISYAARGQTPPRVKVRLARLEHAHKNGKPNYGFAPYLADLWADAWRDARQRREARRANGKPERKPGLRRYLATRWNDAWDAAETKHRAKRENATTDEANRGERDGAQATDPDDSNTPGKPAPRPDPDGPADPGGSAQLPDHAPQTPTSRMASVTPIRNTKEDQPMQSINTEVNSLTAAKQYADDMSKSAAAAVGSIEQTLGHLAASEVTGEATDRFAEAQELAQEMAEKFRSAYAALSKQDGVKDAYQSAPGAGNKAFVTG
ncbi:MAG: hypothetical protein ACRDT6_16190, partial [Micromonosporaceae bacterium]